MSACLTTHILDLASGKPANLVKVELYNSTGKLLKKVHTNKDGRLSSPLLTENEMKKGEFELLFYIGDYFRETHLSLAQPPFLNKIPVRFNINDSTQHYHVPLLLSPLGYQIYRGR
ncbi:hydroxyisourate hydrolase [Priestia endophytica]|uniref:5-hydroxyisourate hydrolase n=1 Tax=Priestia endophytica DSM 13796 TaxID=1121089 RepID=A0A1I5YW04_9BACI|nr:hydroxyisourate hydrolase [Priestia endophytica]KAB2495364.1 hydroxyisourate hydrolase [Priestia endophytica]KYG27993.1 5-hydroxyisourate hydrolase [Priestia endophytica]MBG9813989.1 5-hydroxyisourate hydrolase [Priestia endophytica]RAS79107.1 hydroxyisourate hydrolase [Priestia endophytica]SFQ48451.1 5-hydroxyisourate hydrolase [Priestia endophytica DSM 13796]